MSGSELFSHGDKVQWNSEPNVPNNITPEQDARYERLCLAKIKHDMEAAFLNFEKDAETVLSMTDPVEIAPNTYKALVDFEEFEELGANTFEGDFVYNIVTGEGRVG